MQTILNDFKVKSPIYKDLLPKQRFKKLFAPIPDSFSPNLPNNQLSMTSNKSKRSSSIFFNLPQIHQYKIEENLNVLNHEDCKNQNKKNNNNFNDKLKVTLTKYLNIKDESVNLQKINNPFLCTSIHNFSKDNNQFKMPLLIKRKSFIEQSENAQNSVQSNQNSLFFLPNENSLFNNIYLESSSMSNSNSNSKKREFTRFRSRYSDPEINYEQKRRGFKCPPFVNVKARKAVAIIKKIDFLNKSIECSEQFRNELTKLIDLFHD
jgi:hypothetical protein